MGDLTFSPNIYKKILVVCGHEIFLKILGFIFNN